MRKQPTAVLCASVARTLACGNNSISTAITRTVGRRRRVIPLNKHPAEARKLAAAALCCRHVAYRVCVVYVDLCLGPGIAAAFQHVET